MEPSFWEAFLWGFLTCAFLDVVVLLFFRVQFKRVLGQLDGWIGTGRWDA